MFHSDALTHSSYTRYVSFRLIDADKPNTPWKEQIMKLIMHSSRDSC